MSFSDQLHQSSFLRALPRAASPSHFDSSFWLLYAGVRKLLAQCDPQEASGPSHQTRPARQLHSHSHPRLPRQNEPFAGTARPLAPNQTPLHHHLNLLGACTSKTNRPDDPGLAEKGEPKGNKIGREESLAGLHHNNFESNFLWRLTNPASSTSSAAS